MAFQKADDVVCLLHRLLNGNGLGENIDTGIDSGSHRTVNVLGVKRVGGQTAGRIPPQSHANHGKVHTVRSHSLPVNGVVFAGTVLIGRDIDAETSLVLPAHIGQPVTVPDKVPLRQAVAIHAVVERYLIPVVADIAVGIHPGIVPGGRG